CSPTTSRSAKAKGFNAREALAEASAHAHVQELVGRRSSADGSARPVARRAESEPNGLTRGGQPDSVSESFVDSLIRPRQECHERALGEGCDSFYHYSGGVRGTRNCGRNRQRHIFIAFCAGPGEDGRGNAKQQAEGADDFCEAAARVLRRPLVPQPLRHGPGLVAALPGALPGRLQLTTRRRNPTVSSASWNVKFRKDSPEFVFHCQSPVTSACFAKFHRNLIVGGTYSGQVVLWDNRNTQADSLLSVCVLGSENAHNLVSASSDGRLCTWSLDMLSQPQETLDLQRQNRPVPATCLDFAPSDANHFGFGSEDYSMYTGCRHGAKAGIMDALDGHQVRAAGNFSQGPVSAVATHRATGQSISATSSCRPSFDWTVRLWSLRDLGTVHVFEETSDYVMDLCWSPVNPALFCAADALGRLDFLAAELGHRAGRRQGPVRRGRHTVAGSATPACCSAPATTSAG
uniref:WD_REPEATS_REGION domain-containing protein n=1 Tax=Macrostomum lignano TaxID=282301 RepID=A0A1I8JNJ8_9PLAT